MKHRIKIWWDSLWRQQLDQELQHYFGYELMLLGSSDTLVVNASPIAHQFCITESSQSHLPSAIAVYHQLPFAPDSVDVIVALHLIEAYPQFAQQLKAMAEVLRYDGTLILLCCNSRRAGIARKLIAKSQKIHTLNTVETILVAAEQAGLELLKLKSFGFWPG